MSNRPPYGIQIYSTIPGAATPDFLDSIATKTFKATFDEERGSDVSWMRRLDFYGLELPHGTSENEIVDRYITHQKLDRVARSSTGTLDLFIPGTYSREYHWRSIYIIVECEENWGKVVMPSEENAWTPATEGAFLEVRYDLPVMEREEDDQVSEVFFWHKMNLERLNKSFDAVMINRQGFYDSVVADWGKPEFAAMYRKRNE